MFGNGNYATVKSSTQLTDNNGNPKTVYECKLFSQKKDSVTKKYKADFVSNFVYFYGKAFEKHPIAGQRIKILECGVQNCWVNDQDEIKFCKNPRYMIFDYELLDDSRDKKLEIVEAGFSGEEFRPF